MVDDIKDSSVDRERPDITLQVFQFSKLVIASIPCAFWAFY